MSKPRKQHYLPRCYLEGFAPEGRLWVYERGADRAFPVTPKNAAREGDLYTI